MIVIPFVSLAVAAKLSIVGYAVGGAMVGASLIVAMLQICRGIKGKKRQHGEEFGSSYTGPMGGSG